MTIADEITRIQWAKTDIRQAIIDKWVDVWEWLTLDSYADCILAIPASTEKVYLDYLLIWWGWGWGIRWWWGWWDVLRWTCFFLDNVLQVTLWDWWASWGNWWNTSLTGEQTNIVSRWGCAWWWSWWNSWSWCAWWGNTNRWWGWGWGAGGNWISWSGAYYWWAWWAWLYWYWWWWGWGWCKWAGGASDWWWAGSTAKWWDATTYWWGGWWWKSGWWTWYKWYAVICYKTDGTCGITNATGWTVTTSWGFKIHTFTSNWTFTIIS